MSLTYQISHTDMFGSVVLFNLKEDGDQIPVTKENRQVRPLGSLWSFITFWFCFLVLLEMARSILPVQLLAPLGPAFVIYVGLLCIKWKREKNTCLLLIDL